MTNQNPLEGFDLGALVEQAQALQEQMEAAQEQNAQKVLTGTAGGGKVEIEVTGAGEFRNVKIAPEAVDADDVELLEELVLAALRDASTKMAVLQQQATEGFEMPDMDALGGMLGLE